MRKIILVTSTRADWGLLRPVAQRIADSDDMELFLAVTGTHLLADYGATVSEIIADGFEPGAQVDIMKYGFGRRQSAKTIALTIDKFTDLISRQKPDIVLLLGDRYEIFAVACAAAALSVPIAHISGGDVTLGAKDDYYRHCITKMASLHFPSCADSARRIIQLGEEPGRVFNVGGLGNENIKNTPLMSIEQLEESLDFKNLRPFALITYHPETQKSTGPRQDMRRLFDALDRTQLNLIFTKSNADAGGDIINSMVDEYCVRNSRRAKAFYSLGLKRYLSAMKYTRAVIGNSSSGVVETPAFGTPTVNIGDRQKGRFIAENVICTGCDAQRIYDGICKALSPRFAEVCRNVTNPYDAGFPASEKIARIIKNYPGQALHRVKNFYDIKGEYKL